MSLKVNTLPNVTVPYSSPQVYKSPCGGYDLHQTLSGRLNVKLQLTGDDFVTTNGGPKVHKKFLYVDFGGSEMGVGSSQATGPGTQGYFDQDDIRGYYIEKLSCLAWLQRSGDAPDPDKASPNWTIQTESPEGTNQSGSISSSVSYNVNGSAGFFGDTPTGNAGGGVTFGTTRSHSVTDFTFAQHSDANVLRHEITMSQSRGGKTYSSWMDLVSDGAPNLINAKPELNQPPVLALSNLPIPGQAVWMNENAAGLAEQLTLHVSINPTYVVVEGVPGQGSLLVAGLAGVFAPGAMAGQAAQAMPHYKHIAFGGPWTNSFDIDLSLA
ncbi:hypothetical protein [Ideonella sp. A 288]|uniref:hypothetical protein n=1 Tax=Ideonella sp. A 288 TaxID=1962181 RepID=UPI000B4B1546|nr:hypothetical protein [Ideonella sp. A 288]